MKRFLKIGLVLFIGSIILTSCNDKKGSSTGLFEEKISVSMQGKILAVAKNKEVKFYEFKEKDSANVEKTEVFKTKFSQDIDEIEFLFWSSTFVIRENQTLKFYKPTKDSLELLHTYHIPMEKISDIVIGSRTKILIRDGLVIKHFQAEKDSLKFVRDIDLKTEEQLNNIDEMTRFGEHIILRDNDVLYTRVNDKREQFKLPQEKFDEIFNNGSGLFGIRYGKIIKFYEAKTKKDTLTYIPNLDFEIK